MIAANQATAAYLKSHGVPSFVTFCVHLIEATDRRDGGTLGRGFTGRAQRAGARILLVTRRKADPVRFPDLSLAIVKLIGRGEYVLDQSKDGAPEHFGLAIKDYTHSTAPNLHFPDLITQRLTKAALSGAPLTYRPDELEYLAGRCTEKEDDAERGRTTTEKISRGVIVGTANWRAV